MRKSAEMLTGPCSALGTLSHACLDRIARHIRSDEARNADDNGRLFVSRSLSENPGAPGGAFDDRVTWISPNLIAHRLIGVDRLP